MSYRLSVPLVRHRLPFVVDLASGHQRPLMCVVDNTPTQTDAKDAWVIARLVSDGRWFRWEPRAGALAPSAVARRQRWRSRIAGWLHQYFPEFRTGVKARDGKPALTALDVMPTPNWVLAQSVDTLTDQFKAAINNRVGAKRAHALHCNPRRPGHRASPIGLPSYLRSWRAALAAQMAIEAEQAAILAVRTVADPLSSLAGFGPQLIATLRGEWGDLSRFADSRQTQKMAGLNLTQISSGYHQGPTHIAKRGRPAAGVIAAA